MWVHVLRKMNVFTSLNFGDTFPKDSKSSGSSFTFMNSWNEVCFIHTIISMTLVITFVFECLTSFTTLKCRTSDLVDFVTSCCFSLFQRTSWTFSVLSEKKRSTFCLFLNKASFIRIALSYFHALIRKNWVSALSWPEKSCMCHLTLQPKLSQQLFLLFMTKKLKSGYFKNQRQCSYCNVTGQMRVFSWWKNLHFVKKGTSFQWSLSWKYIKVRL